MLIPVCFLILCFVLIIILRHLSRRKYNYWKQRNVPFLEPLSFFGNYKDYILMKLYPPDVTKQICKQFPDAPYVGVYYGTEPALVIKDLELIKLITIKDFYYFNGREISEYTHKEVVTQNIFFAYGDGWKVQRQNMAPLLTPTKVRNMFYLVKECGIQLESLLDKLYKTSTRIDVKDLTSRYTIDVVMICAFGINSDVMGDNVKTNPFRVISEKILEPSLSNGVKYCARSLWPRIFYALGFKIFGDDVNSFFHNMLTEVFVKRDYKPSCKNDFVDLLLSLRQKKFIYGDSLNPLKTGDDGKIRMEVNDDFLVAQSVAFFAGGFETSAIIFSLALYELAKNEEVQKRAIADVDNYLHHHKDGVEYDVINRVPYLEACLDETIRLYPLLGDLTRETMEQYTLPDGLVLEKGLRIHIPVSYLHTDPDHFPNPEEYEPERFLDEWKYQNNGNAYFPFGAGARMCIGMPFAKLLVLTGLVSVLKKYRLTVAADTPGKVHNEPKTISAKPVEQINLILIPRN